MKPCSDILAAVIMTACHAAAVATFPEVETGLREAAVELRRLVPTDAELSKLEDTFRMCLLIVERARNFPDT